MKDLIEKVIDGIGEKRNTVEESDKICPYGHKVVLVTNVVTADRLYECLECATVYEVEEVLPSEEVPSSSGEGSLDSQIKSDNPAEIAAKIAEAIEDEEFKIGWGKPLDIAIDWMSDYEEFDEQYLELRYEMRPMQALMLMKFLVDNFSKYRDYQAGGK